MPKYSDKQIADGLRASRGMVYVAARQMGCSPDTIKARLSKSEKLRAIQTSESEIVLDSAELKLGQAMMNGESWAIKFLLSTKGKSRGYVERSEVSQDVTITDGNVRDERFGALFAQLDAYRTGIDDGDGGGDRGVPMDSGRANGETA